MKKYLVVSFIYLSGWLLAQKQITIKVIDDLYQNLKGVTISNENQKYKTNASGETLLTFQGKTLFQVQLEGYVPTTIELNEKSDSKITILLPSLIGYDEVVFTKQKKEKSIGGYQLKTNNLGKLPSLTGGIEELLKSFPMVNSNTELSSQYMVRGGNYDENLVYVNGIEIYKPQLVRSGQQEGMSFLNPSMVQNISFSAGGFEAKYGDKMSSVLDIYYKEPRDNKPTFTADASLLGGSLTAGIGSKDKKLSVIMGARYRDMRLLLDKQDENADFKPTYFDYQANIVYRLNQQWKFNILGGYAQNDFKLEPKSRETTFGSINNPYKLLVDYEGQEKDLFKNTFASLTTSFKPNNHLQLLVDLGIQHGVEEEHFDIKSTYTLGQIDPISGLYVSSIDAAGQIDHARNNLDYLITSIQHRGQYKITNGHIDWGIKYEIQDFRNRLDEYHRVDSAGYIRPITANSSFNYLFDVTNINQNRTIKNNRINAYLQYSKKHQLESGKLFYNIGIRTAHLDFNDEWTFSPRMQIAFKPDWEKDMLFRFATGVYYQTPFYKDLMDVYGDLHPEIQSQRSIHFIAANEYEFSLGKKHDRQPFKLTTEVYYKLLDDIIPYYVDNVRTIYWGTNNATGNQYGIDMRLNGEFSKGSESWLSLSYARAEWDIAQQGTIDMPTNQGLKVGLFYQDYMPAFPSFKVYLNAVYAQGLPNGAPIYTDPYQFQGNLNNYKRLDIGFTKYFIDETSNIQSQLFKHFKELALGVEVFNLLDIENQISNLWVADLASQQYYGVPNRLTGRFINLKLSARF